MSGNSRSRRRSSAPNTSWDHLATWYDGWVGDAGSRYHRAIAIPVLLELLDPRPGERILDVGCGQGVLAQSIHRAAAEYVGVDASPRMVSVAARRHGRDGRFVVGDARTLHTTSVGARPFDAATFLLSLQDMDDVGRVIRSVSGVLAARSRIVILLTHPAFRVPRHSGWGVDPERGLRYRRVDAYLTSMAVPLRGRPGSGPTTSFHRPLSVYVEALAAQGYAIDAVREPPDLPDAAGNPDIPIFLALRGRRGDANEQRRGPSAGTARAGSRRPR